MQTYEFRRTSLWGNEQELLSAGQRVGYVKKTSVWRSGAVAELPGMPVPAQVFAFAVGLTMWARAASASGTDTTTWVTDMAASSPPRPTRGQEEEAPHHEDTCTRTLPSQDTRPMHMGDWMYAQ